jgi:two-component system cell cycle sensor histidine kinase/response regulator CckA
LNKFLAGFGEFLQRSLGEAIDVEVAGAAGLWPVEVDSVQLESALVNLAVNARDAMPGGGKLTIEALNSVLDYEYCQRNPEVTIGQYVSLSVTDTGIGMPEDILTHAFEPFFTTKEIGKGTGLGLATVYGIVKQSGGHIHVESAPGQGTTFSVYLPRMADKAPPAESEASRLKAARGTETVLLVEDEDKVRALGCLILRSNGYTVLEARNGPDALAVAERHAGPIDLVVTDVVMPQMNARQLVEQLTPRYPAMKVLYCSGHSDEALLGHGIVDKDAPFLQKPFSLAVLVRKGREVLDQAKK